MSAAERIAADVAAGRGRAWAIYEETDLDPGEEQLVLMIREMQRMHEEQLKPYVDALVRHRSLRPATPFYMRVRP